MNRKEENRAQVDAIKMASGCADCGYRLYPEALDFDHLPNEEKTRNISQMLDRPWEEVEAEITKCEVVCANCHRVRTRSRQVGEREAPGSVAGVFAHVPDRKFTDFFAWQSQVQLIGGRGEEVRVQYFSCWDGHPTNTALIPAVEMADWHFYGSDAEMRNEGDRLNRRRFRF